MKQKLIHLLWNEKNQKYISRDDNKIVTNIKPLDKPTNYFADTWPLTWAYENIGSSDHQPQGANACLINWLGEGFEKDKVGGIPHLFVNIPDLPSENGLVELEFKDGTYNIKDKLHSSRNGQQVEDLTPVGIPFNVNPILTPLDYSTWQRTGANAILVNKDEFIGDSKNWERYNDKSRCISTYFNVKLE